MATSGVLENHKILGYGFLLLIHPCDVLRSVAINTETLYIQQVYLF